MITENSSDEAKARYARFWGALPLTPEQRRAAQPRLYDGTPPKTLGDYASAPRRSKYQQQPSESDTTFTKRLEGAGLVHLAENLPAAELEVVATEYNAALERQQGITHTQLRDHLESRTSGTGIGILGTPSERASALGSRFGGRDVEARGHIVAPAVPGSVTLSMLDRLPKAEQPVVAQRTDVSQLRPTGTGWIGASR